MNPTWDEVYSARFRKLSKEDVEIWGNEVKLEILNLSEDELLNAVRTLANLRRTGKLKYNPTANELISQIIKTRYECRVAREDGWTDDTCAFCKGRGWMSYVECVDHQSGRRELGAAKHEFDTWSEYNMSCPCLCTQGEKMLRKCYKDKDFDYMRDLARRVRDWLVSLSEDDNFDFFDFEE